MPCRSDYMEPNGREIESRKVANHLLYLDGSFGIKVSHNNVIRAAKDVYGMVGQLDEMTEELCTKIRNMSQETKEKALYNGRSSEARALADWWQRHEEFDRKREEQEKAKVVEQERLKVIVQKLTPEELQFLKEGGFKGV